MNLNEQLHETSLRIDSALARVNRGNTVGAEAAYELSRLIRRAEELRVAAARHDLTGCAYTPEQVSAKYGVTISQIFGEKA